MCDVDNGGIDCGGGTVVEGSLGAPRAWCVVVSPSCVCRAVLSSFFYLPLSHASPKMGWGDSEPADPYVALRVRDGLWEGNGCWIAR